MPDIKDMITIASVAVALIGVVYSIINARKTVYINAVTTSRIRYMDNLRTHVSDFCGLTLHVVLTKLEEKSKTELLEKIDRLRFLIKLHLNRTNEVDQKLIASLDRIPDLTHPGQIAELEDELDSLILCTQDVLSFEWAGIKEEADKGRLNKKQRKNFNEKYMPRYLK